MYHIEEEEEEKRVESKIIYKHFYYTAYCVRARVHSTSIFHRLITPQLVRFVCHKFVYDLIFRWYAFRFICFAYELLANAFR